MDPNNNQRKSITGMHGQNHSIGRYYFYNNLSRHKVQERKNMRS